MLDLSNFGLQFENNVVIIARVFTRINYLPKFVTKNALSFLGQNFRKLMSYFEINILEFFKNEFLIHATNFGINSTFSKGPGSAYFERPGQGPLYKNC